MLSPRPAKDLLSSFALSVPLAVSPHRPRGSSLGLKGKPHGKAP